MDTYEETSLSDYFTYFNVNLVVISFFLFKINNILSFLMKYYKKSTPNVVNNKLEINTTLGNITVPWYKMPCLEYDMYFFYDEMTDIDENFLMKEKVFNELFKDIKLYELPRIKNGIIGNIIKPSQFNNNKKITGVIRSFLDDYVYIFTVVNDEVIDYKKIMNEYAFKLENMDEDYLEFS